MTREAEEVQDAAEELPEEVAAARQVLAAARQGETGEAAGRPRRRAYEQSAMELQAARWEQEAGVPMYFETQTSARGKCLEVSVEARQGGRAVVVTMPEVLTLQEAKIVRAMLDRAVKAGG